MHYIRFLKTPRVQIDHGTVQLRAVLTVTTDLGETFYADELELVATLRDVKDDGEIYLRRRVHWPAGARALPVAFNLTYQDVDWPACLHVECKNPPTAGTTGSKSSTSHGSVGGGFLPSIVDIWSGALNPTKGQMDSGTRVERRFTSSAERTVSLLEDAGDSIARHLWDGSQALAQHIDQTLALSTPTPLPLLEFVLVSATYRKLHVLELGCGVGTVGISLAQTVPDCDVILTDLPAVEPLATANIARMSPAISSRVSFLPLDWEDAETSSGLDHKLLSRSNDLIIVSECTYNSDTLAALVSTISALLVRSPKAIVVVATKTRHTSESAFFDLVRQAGLVEGGVMRVPLPGVPGTGYADAATDVGVFVFHSKEHRLSLSPRNSGNEVPTARASQRARAQRGR